MLGFHGGKSVSQDPVTVPLVLEALCDQLSSSISVRNFGAVRSIQNVVG